MNEKNEVAVVEKSALVPMEFNTSQVDLIKKTVAKGTTNDELALFLYTCKRTGLDPLIKQIYAVKRGGASNQMSIQTGIDGYRLIAERSGKYAPGKEPLFVDDASGKLKYATAYVNKLVGGTWHEVAATAYYVEYFTPTNNIWIKMPHAMLAKCAEALALRKAFPAEMAGVYTHEEMIQADNPAIPSAPERKSAQEPTTEALEAQRQAKAKEYAAQGHETAPQSSQPPLEGHKTATGQVAKHFPPKGASKYHSFAIAGFDGMYFSTADMMIVETLEGKIESGEIVSVEYTESEWEKNGKKGINRAIVGLSVQQS